MKCKKCGKRLLRITDDEIIGAHTLWHVCPMVLYGCGKKDHTSYYEEDPYAF